MARFRPTSHKDRLSLVEHLDELRFRIIVTVAAFVVAFALSFWQNHLVLDLLNRPLPHGFRPTTLSPAEPFMTTIAISAYAAIVLTLPIAIYQLYAFVLPALSPDERRATTPVLLLIPLLLAAGIVFGYFIVLPAAVKFLLNFNDTQFTVQVRAREYYSFVALVCLIGGVVFQLPVGILAAARLGVVSARQLRHNRRGAYVLIAILAAALPGVDPVTMLLEMVPLIALYELSIVLVALLGGRREAGRSASSEASQP